MNQYQLERRAFDRLPDEPVWTEQERSKLQQRLRNLQNDVEQMMLSQTQNPSAWPTSAP